MRNEQKALLIKEIQATEGLEYRKLIKASN